MALPSLLVCDPRNQKKTLEVPVTREEVYLQCREVDRPADRPIEAGSERTIEVPLREEQVVLVARADVGNSRRVAGHFRRSVQACEPDGLRRDGERTAQSHERKSTSHGFPRGREIWDCKPEQTSAVARASSLTAQVGWASYLTPGGVPMPNPTASGSGRDGPGSTVPAKDLERDAAVEVLLAELAYLDPRATLAQWDGFGVGHG